MPEGLKPHGLRLSKLIEERTDAEVIVSGDPCYGACDLATYARDLLKADILLHVGHAEIPPERTEGVIYAEARSTAPIDRPMKEALNLLRQEECIGLAATVQHLDRVQEAKRILEENGKTVIIGKPSGWLKYHGQILGCDYSSLLGISKNVDAFLIIAGGDFHALGAQLATGKKTVVVDPFEENARDLSEAAKKVLKQRWAMIEKFREAKNVAIIVGLKTAQMKYEHAKSLKKLVEDNGKKCIIISAVELVPESLQSFIDVDAFVETACLRIATDDQERCRKPILNSEELLVALGKKSWEDYAEGGAF